MLGETSVGRKLLKVGKEQARVSWGEFSRQRGHRFKGPESVERI